MKRAALLSLRVLLTLGVMSAVAALSACGQAPESARQDEKVLRVVPQTDLEILDPTSTTAYLTRDHGYLVYDTLFGLDARGEIQPQMVDAYEVSADKKTWTFTLRDSLEFHDGQPVTSDDVIASIQRWAVRDTLGQRLLSFVERLDAPGPRTFRMTLRAPYGLVLESLAKPDSYLLFIFPARLAAAATPIDDPIGSGPFIFKKDEWKPGEKVVYVRNPKYKPRQEPPSGTAGGKVVKVDRVEWVIIKDPQTQVNALRSGAVDMIAQSPVEFHAALKADSSIQLLSINPSGFQYYLRFNHLAPPFDNPKVRHAAMAAMNQPAFLRTQVGIPHLYNTCFSIYTCGSSYATEAAMDFLAKPDPAHAAALLKASGYHGERIVVMQATDLSVLAKLPVVGTDLLRKAGFTVEMQSMDQNTLLARRVGKDGWHIFFSYGAWWPRTAPVSENALSAACHPQAWFGWPCDQELEALRDAFALAGTDEDRRAIAERIQVRAMAVGTHVPLGEFRTVTAAHRNLFGFVTGANSTVYWNLEKR
jgi:peptide/nickel transport system substrate-binding protein